MKVANIVKTENLEYKNGFIQCACGWRKELGNGFNGYHIANCPNCTPALEIRTRRKVVYGYRNNLTVELGCHTYFVLSNGIHVRYKAIVYATYTGLSRQRANAL